ncbi:MAG TPA: NAD(P)H-hydrate epimerase [Planctomycetota bacterium]|nr:NAD(P)H-hydrate epimerase [Planctomycetota bacterium]
MSPSSNRSEADGRPAPRPCAPFPPPPQTRESIREWDRRAIVELAIPGVVLMENAGAGAARGLLTLGRDEPDLVAEPILVLCGPGNNGGDGFVIARYLHQAGLEVAIRGIGLEKLRPGSEAALHLEIVKRIGLPIDLVPPGHPPSRSQSGVARGDGTIIDALFGTGLTRELRTPFIEWVQAINSRCGPVVSLDIPTGLDANTGEVLGDAVKARHTFTFAAAKVGFERGRGPELCGAVHVVDIGLPRELWEPRGPGPKSPGMGAHGGSAGTRPMVS